MRTLLLTLAAILCLSLPAHAAEPAVITVIKDGEELVAKDFNVVLEEQAQGQPALTPCQFARYDLSESPDLKHLPAYTMRCGGQTYRGYHHELPIDGFTHHVVMWHDYPITTEEMACGVLALKRGHERINLDDCDSLGGSWQPLETGPRHDPRDSIVDEFIGQPI